MAQNAKNMPLVMMCGTPASGKTRRAGELAAYLTAHHPEFPIQMVNEESLGIVRDTAYKGKPTHVFVCVPSVFSGVDTCV